MHPHPDNSTIRSEPSHERGYVGWDALNVFHLEFGFIHNWIYMRLLITPALFILLFLSLLLQPGQSFAQSPKLRSLLFDAGMGFHGSGDLLGGAGHFGYEHQIAGRFSLRYQLGATFHGGSAYGFDIDDGFSRSVPMYFVTAGVQSAALAVLHVGGVRRQWFNIAAGPLVRFQLDGYPTSYSYSYDPPRTYGSYTVGEIQPRILTLGYKVQLESHLVHLKKLSLGLGASFQNDTNGDAITNVSLLFRRPLN
jgi:hypothetical protein